ncbi:MAG: YegP family protein [Bacteroidota bacterium]
MPFEIFQSEKNEQYYFRLKAGNGEVILQSEGYTSKADAENGVQAVLTYAPHEANYGQLPSADGQRYFVLIAANGEVIGKSEMYKAKQGLDNGIQSVITNTTNNPEIKDLT